MSQYCVYYTFEDGTQKEKIFNSPDEVCQFLEIGKTTFYKLRNGEMKFHQKKTQKFKNLTFKKIDPPTYYHQNKEKIRNRPKKEVVDNVVNKFLD